LTLRSGRRSVIRMASRVTILDSELRMLLRHAHALRQISEIACEPGEVSLIVAGERLTEILQVLAAFAATEKAAS